MSIRANGHHRGRRIEKTLHERRSQIYAPPCNSRRKVLSLRREIINTAPASCPLSRGERPSPVAGGISEMGQVTSFGSRSVNGGNGAEATDQDFVVCVRFPVCGDQKQTVGFRPSRFRFAPMPAAQAMLVASRKRTLGRRHAYDRQVPSPDIHASSPKKTRMPSGAPACEPLRSAHSGRLTSAKFSI
jgi:hypothetical protein